MDKTMSVRAVQPVARVSRLVMQTNKPGPKAWAIDEARKAGAECARQRFNRLDDKWTPESTPLADARDAFQAELRWSTTSCALRGANGAKWAMDEMRPRTAQHVVDAFCDGYDEAIDNFNAAAER